MVSLVYFMENIYKWMITRGTTMDWKPPNDGSAVFIVPQKWWSYPGLFYPHSHDPPVFFLHHNGNTHYFYGHFQ